MSLVATLVMLLPAFVGISVGVIAGHAPLTMRPAFALRALTAVAAVAAFSALSAVGMLSAGLLARTAFIEQLVAWCPAIPLHDQISYAIGLPAVAALGAIAYRVYRVFSLRRWAVAGTKGRRLLVLETPEPIAYAAPGRPGCVVVSKGILQLLRPEERRVLFAHERAHLDQHHDRHLAVAAIAVAAVPLLAPLATQIRLATERCADEAAVKAVGGDRELVATAIARAAVSLSEYSDSQDEVDQLASTAHFKGGASVQRVAALIGAPASPASLLFGAAVAVAILGIVSTAASVQVLHLAEFVGHICNF